MRLGCGASLLEVASPPEAIFPGRDTRCLSSSVDLTGGRRENLSPSFCLPPGPGYQVYSMGSWCLLAACMGPGRALGAGAPVALWSGLAMPLSAPGFLGSTAWLSQRVNITEVEGSESMAK